MIWAGLAQVEFVFQLPQSLIVDAAFVAQTHRGPPLQPKQITRKTGQAFVMFGALLVTAVNGMVSIDRKRRHALGGLWDEFAARTSRLPFAAILAGRTRFEMSEFRAWQIALAVVLFHANGTLALP